MQAWEAISQCFLYRRLLQKWSSWAEVEHILNAGFQNDCATDTPVHSARGQPCSAPSPGCLNLPFFS